MYAWAGKMLRVNLSNNSISEFSIEPYANYYLGGRGIASRIYWEEVPAGIKAFDPENKLIFVNGLLVGTGAQASTVMAVTGKSPSVYPEGYCYGYIAGFLGTEFRKAGYQGIVIEGRAPSPVYIAINDSHVEIRPATHIWGKRAYASGDALLEENEGFKFLTIGISGELKVRTSIALASADSTLSCGFAAVMGSKNLKGLVVKGSGEIQVARPEEFKELTRYSYKVNKTIHLEIPPQITKTGHSHVLEAIGKDTCYKCGSSCTKNVYRYGKRDDLVVTRRCQPIEYYLPWLYGHDDEPIETLFHAPEMANDYALETFELENIVRWLFACYEAGALSEKETGLPLSKIGTMEFLNKLLHDICYREGFGELLAEGQLRAGDSVSPQAKALFSHQTTGVGQYETAPTRRFVVQSLMIPMEPRAHQPIVHAMSFPFLAWATNLENPELSPVDTGIFYEIAKAFFGSEEAGDVTSYKGKGLAARKIQNRVYLHDSLGLCNFTWPATYSFNTDSHVGDPNLEAKLFAAATGFDGDKLEEFGNNMVDLQRAILLREGRKLPEGDYPREYLFTEPLMEGPLMAPGPNGPIDITGNKLENQQYSPQ